MPSIRLVEITRLHEEIETSLKMTVAKATRIGQLLEEQFAATERGEWGQWMAENLPFSEATAKNYRMLYRKRAEVEKLTVSDLGDVYRALRRRPKPADPNKKYTLDFTEEELKEFKSLALVLINEVFEADGVAAAVLQSMRLTVDRRTEINV